MCGRMFAQIEFEELSQVIDIRNKKELPFANYSNFNIAPTNKVVSYQSKEIALKSFGADMKGNFLINARVETFLNKSIYKKLQACTVVVQGYFEWFWR